MNKLYIIIHIFILIVSISSVSAIGSDNEYNISNQDTQIVAAFPFDMDCKSVAGNTGLVCTNFSISIVAGNISGGLNLNGAGYVRVDDDPDFDDVRSISMFVKKDGFSGDSNNDKAIINKRTDNPNTGLKHLPLTDALVFNDGTTFTASYVIDLDDKWTFLIMTVDASGDGKIYESNISGPRAEGASYIKDFWNNANALNIGGNGVSNRYFKGIIDEVILWNVTFEDASATVLANLYISGGNPLTPPVPESETSTPTIELPSPIDGAANNTNVTLNVSHGTTNNDIRYYLYFADTPTLNESHYQLFNVTRTAEEYSLLYHETH